MAGAEVADAAGGVGLFCGGAFGCGVDAMSKSKINKCRRVGDSNKEQPWFISRRKRNRVRNRITKESRRVNRA